VTVHVYAPPLAELRHFTIRPQGRPVAGAFTRRRAPGAPVVAIIGGGFSGATVAVQLARRTAQFSRPLHVVILDRQTSIAEGAAYRTSDASHLLNVPASGMSAWPDRSDDFLDWARRRQPGVQPDAFLPRRSYGDYLRDTLFKAIAQAGSQMSFEFRAAEVTALERRQPGGWRVHCSERTTIAADAVVLATGHRPIVDPLKGCWSGARTRYIEDPWASAALSSIEPHESVCLLGSGLTAMDTLQTLTHTPRSGQVLALSRRGLLPLAHAAAPLPAIDPRRWLDRFLQEGAAFTTLELDRAIRRAIHDAEAAGRDWRQVIDGLRPHISRLGKALPPAEMSRFLRHARPFWEIARHRMPPAVAERVQQVTGSGIFAAAAARVLSGRGAQDRVMLTVRRRGEAAPDTLRFDWVVNCTGPGSGRGVNLPPVIAGLIKAGYLEEDSFGLGVRSTVEGRALTRGLIVDDLLLVGSLRKADLWESTAVPELRQQAARAADLLIQIPLSGDASIRAHRSHQAHSLQIHAEQAHVTR
jgi:uncharacterized NAD(P)/FAD-binding protein YdhS